MRSQLEHELEKLPLEGYHLHVARGSKAGIEGVKFDVHLDSEHHHHATRPDRRARAPRRTRHSHAPITRTTEARTFARSGN